MPTSTPRLPVHSSALTDRQREVLALIARGRTNFEIATALGVSLETVKYHVTEILTRLEVESREDAAAIYRGERSVGARLRVLVPSFSGHWAMAAGGAGLVVVVAALAVLVISAMRGSSDSNDVVSPPPDESATAQPSATAAPTQAPAPSRVMSWLDKDGRLEMPVFDDRQVPDEIRATYPWPNPRWAPFNRCLQAGGYGIEGPIITQAQAQESVLSINAEGPFTARGADGGLVAVESRGLVVFAGCSYILELERDELAPLLQPGDPTGEMPIIP